MFMDIRTIACAILSGIALIGSIILFVYGQQDDATRILGVATTFGAFVIGLYSEPHAGE